MEVKAKYTAGLPLKSIDYSVIKTLLYFDIFKYPLTASEIFENCPTKLSSAEEIKITLESLISAGYIFCSENYYFLHSEKNIIRFRETGNKKAQKYLARARFFTWLISSFPFVEAVFLTGSLSKGMIEKKGDVDYFIITRPGKLWFCRTILITFKKLFLFNSRKYFCVNYFIDSEHLQIYDKNIFTATEVVYAIPAYNKDICNKFFLINNWYADYYPNKKNTDTRKTLKYRIGILRTLFEKIFNGKLGDKIDSWCFRKTINHWKKKYADYDEAAFDFNFRSYKHVSKHHPSGFQFKILNEYERKVKEFETTHNICLR